MLEAGPDFGRLVAVFASRGCSMRLDAFGPSARLCWLIESLDLPRTSTSWSVRVFHGEQRTVAWTTRSGRTVTLSDYGYAGPPAVGALAAAIENTARGLDWAAAEERGKAQPR